MKSITREDVTYYGKFAAATVVGVGVGLTGYAANDTPTKKTDTYKNLQDELGTLEGTNEELDEKVTSLQTAVTDKEERVNALEASVEQRQKVIKDLRAENADLEEALAAPQERAGLVDYLPVFSDSDVELDGNIAVEVDEPVTDGEGDYDRLDVDYTSDDGQYDVTVTEYEESEDAEDAVEDFRETQTPVKFSTDGDEHTVTLNGYEGQVNEVLFEYEDFDAIEDVDHEDDIESVVVDGEDITDRVEKVEQTADDFRVHLDEDYYANDGDSITVTFSDASDEGELTKVRVHDGSNSKYGSDYNYDQDDDTREEVYRDGDTVVEVEGTDNGDEFEAQYEDLTTHYE